VKRVRATWLVPVLGLCVLAEPGPARAVDGFDLEVWQPVHDGTGAITTQGIESHDDWTVLSGASLDYARAPLRLMGGSGTLAPLITGATTVDFGLAMALPYRFTFELDVPAARHKVLDSLGADGSNDVAAEGVGDVRAGLKYTIFPGGDLLPGVAAGGGFSAPTGDGASWFGSNALEGRVYGVIQERVGDVTLMANAGSHLRPRTATVWGKRIGSSATGNIGAAWNTGLFGVTLLADGYGAYAFRSKEAPFEAGGGIRRELTPGVTATAGANHGLGHALGTPSWRVFAMLDFDASAVRRRPRALLMEVAALPTPAPLPAPTPEPDPVLPVEHFTMEPIPVPTATPAPVPVPTLVARLEPDPVLSTAPRVVIEEKSLSLNQSIHFSLNLFDIKPDSFPILDALASVLVAHPEIARVSIEGHTDSNGSTVLNDYLSKMRAVSVKNYLVKKGVAIDRLQTAGFGPKNPIATNRTGPGRAMNRRVEFRILKRE
jgi:OOP family OmpA-OmpF porin